MSATQLLLQSVRHYWRTHLGVVLGVALATLVLTGSLMVGDSVKATLKSQAEARIGKAMSALTCGERFVPWRSAQGQNQNAQIPEPFQPSHSAGVLVAQATAQRPDGKSRLNRVQVLGVDAHFWKLSPSGQSLVLAEGSAAVNERLAAQLGVKAGDSLTIRMEKPGAISKDAPLSGEQENGVVVRVKISAILGDSEFGRFSLTSGQVPPASIFLPVEALQKSLGVNGKVNLVLDATPRDRIATLPEIARAPESLELELRDIPGGGVELRTSRVFLDEAVVSAAHEMEKEAKAKGAAHSVDTLTYFVTGLHAGDGTDAKGKFTPYSMVAAVDAPSSGFLQAELAEDEIQITRWLADDLGVGVGDKVTVKYFVMGDRRQLTEKSRTFTILGPIIEMNEPQLNTSWMPEFPNIPEKDGLKGWKPGFPFESSRIRKKDEDYWAEYRGTPKAFVNLRVGQEMWGNRWGNLTSIRYPAGTDKAGLKEIVKRVDPASLGFRVVDLRGDAMAATNAPVDFGQLFGGFSFFLILAAAVLTGLLFTFSIEQRATEAGLLLAIGWRSRAVQWLFLREGLILALIGSAIGTAGAIGYTRLVLEGLESIWSGATGGTHFVFALSPATLGVGVGAGVFIAAVAMWLASRKLFRAEAAGLLSGGVENSTLDAAAAAKGTRMDWTIGIVSITAALVLAVVARGNPGAFFGAGSLLLLGGMYFGRGILKSLALGTGLSTMAELAARNTSRRAGRSLATVAVLASGVFMVVAVDSFRKGPLDDPSNRQSGTGGFALVGESSAPIYEDLNSQSGREKLLPDYDQLPKELHVVQARVREGDDASCLNLNRAVQPRLLGVQPDEMKGRFTFNAPSGTGWEILNGEDGEVPAVVDANTLQWAMQKKIGDVLEYTDERGKPLKVRVAATVSGSMLQGLVVISEKRFIQAFPNAAGYRFFLVDAPTAELSAVRESLSAQLSDQGLELIPAAQRLADFNAVENTYLSIFQVLGGLGMLLGSAGLGIVVARNVLERRREFGLLAAVGFTPAALRRLVFAEHRWLLAGALLLGAASALLAVWPQLSKSANFPWMQVATLFAGMALIAAACALAATRISIRHSQLENLRAE